jgi:hypothetical protein
VNLAAHDVVVGHYVLSSSVASSALALVRVPSNAEHHDPGNGNSTVAFEHGEVAADLVVLRTKLGVGSYASMMSPAARLSASPRLWITVPPP